MKHQRVPFFPFQLGSFRVLALAVIVLCCLQTAMAREKILHRFSEFPQGNFPGALIPDSKGNFYGVAEGGLYNAGVVYELVPDLNGDVKQAVLYSFTGGLDGGNPNGITMFGGNIYGFASLGGTHGEGTFFELTPLNSRQWKQTVLYNFSDPRSDPFPGGPCADGAGNFFGAVYAFGPTYGFIFELTRSPEGVWTENVIHTFSGGTDGGTPSGGFVFDRSGNLYGAAGAGGTGNNGVVFEFTPAASGTWTETVLYNFAGGDDGSDPGGLIFDAAGNLYGGTVYGGNVAGCVPTGGCGTIFELKPGTGGTWTKNVLYSFGNFTDPTVGASGVVMDNLGNLFGTTYEGGSDHECYAGCGTVFELSPDGNGQWGETVLHNFSASNGYNPGGGVVLGSGGRLYGTTSLGGLFEGLNGTVFLTTPHSDGQWTTRTVYLFPTTDGDISQSTLIADSAGNLYGTTQFGGVKGGGTAFELSPIAGGHWKEQILHTFDQDEFPFGELVIDAAGNLYGTTQSGSVFELTPGAGGVWTEKVIYSIGGAAHGLIFDAAGNLYGTTTQGGSFTRGEVFKLTQQVDGTWTLTILYSFTGPPQDGTFPTAGLIFDAAGNLYGTTSEGGAGTHCSFHGCGTVFQLSPNPGGGWTESVLYSFTNFKGDGAHPAAPVVLDTSGNLYGTTSDGGIIGNCGDNLGSCGTVFKLSPEDGHWTESVLHIFAGTSANDGGLPVAGLVIESGNLYGTTQLGGDVPNRQYSDGLGTVFELSPSSDGPWVETIIHNFGSSTDGASPQGGLHLDNFGNLFGTTAGDANGGSVVFEITP